MSHLLFQFSVLVLSDLFAALFDNTAHSIMPPKKVMCFYTFPDNNVNKYLKYFNRR